MLIDSRMSWYTACRVCERLGGRLACLDSPELRTRVQAELQDFRHNKILLGGYAKRGKWFWLSGAEATVPEEKDVDFVIQCRNTNFIALKDGKFWNCRKARMILCEWPADSPASPLVLK